MPQFGSLNKVMLIGNVGNDIELKTVGNGSSVANFSLATNETWRDKDGNLKQRTDWHNIVGWKKLADECAKYLSKGDMVYIEGKLRLRTWEDKQGNKRRNQEVELAKFVVLTSKEKSDEEDTKSFEDDDLPF